MRCTLGVLILFALCPVPHAAPAMIPQTIELAGVRGRIDHLAIDTLGQRLFVAALGNNSVEIVDLKLGKVTHSIHDLREPQGVVYIPGKNRIYVANGDDGTVQSFEGATFAALQTIELGSDADNLRFNPETNTVYAGFGDGGIAFFDADSGNRVFTIGLTGHPESFQGERSGKRLFVNVPDAGEIAVLDAEKKTVLARWPMGDLKANFPMALDEAHHRLLVGFRRPPMLAVFDTETGKKTFQVTMDPDVDDVFYDKEGKRVFLACGGGIISGGGYLSVLIQEDPDHYRLIHRIPTPKGTRTCLWVPGWNRLFLAVPAAGGRQASIRSFSF